MAAGDHVDDVSVKKSGELKKSDVEERLYTFEVLRIVREAQQQHGLRHGDYQRYRQYCGRRIRRIRKALHFPQGNRYKVQPKKITAELLKDSRCLYLPLVDAERAWAYAMQLKSEANTEPRKKYHMINRLRKAVKHSDVMGTVCDEGSYDARTKLEVQAYRSWLSGLIHLEQEDWKVAMENFSKAKTIYEKLCEAVMESAKELYVQRCEEIEPNIRYCAYNIGDESAVADLMEMRLKISHEDRLTSRLDELIEKTRERQSNTLSEISWLGRTVPVHHEQVRVLLLSIQQNEKQLTASLSTTEQKLSICESMLQELIAAQQALRDALKEDQVFKSGIRGQLPDDGKIPESVYLHTYIAYLRQTTTVQRNLLMIESLKAATGQQEEGKKNRPQDFARLYDVIIQNLMEIPHLPGLEEQINLTKDINVQIVGYKAFRCFHIAQTYSSIKKWKEAIALYEKTLEYAKQAIQDTDKSQLDKAKKAKLREDLEELMQTVDGLKYSVRASSILDSQLLVDDEISYHSKKPLSERLEEYCEDTSLTAKKSNLVQFPPDFQPIPAKPLFFDLALSLVELPSLEDRMEQKTQGGSGLAGFVKGWLWGGGKK